MISALVLQLLQCSVDLPAAATKPKDVLESQEEVTEKDGENSYSAAMSRCGCAASFISHLLQR